MYFMIDVINQMIELVSSNGGLVVDLSQLLKYKSDYMIENLIIKLNEAGYKVDTIGGGRSVFNVRWD